MLKVKVSFAAMPFPFELFLNMRCFGVQSEIKCRFSSLGEGEGRGGEGGGGGRERWMGTGGREGASECACVRP